MPKKISKKGFWNKLLGKQTKKSTPIIHAYKTREIAENTCRNIKISGGKPYLLKIIKK